MQWYAKVATTESMIMQVFSGSCSDCLHKIAGTSFTRPFNLHHEKNPNFLYILHSANVPRLIIQGISRPDQHVISAAPL